VAVPTQSHGRKRLPYRVGSGGGSTTTAGGLVFHGDPSGTIQARDAKTGELLWQFQTGFGAEATPMVYEVDGDQYVAIAAGGNQGVGSANGDAVWAFSLKGQLNPLWPPPPPATVAGPTGPIADDVDYGQNWRQQCRIWLFPETSTGQGGDRGDFTNVGDTPHTATAFENGKIGEWDTGVLSSGESKTVTFDKPGSYYYICTPHPWMYGQVIVPRWAPKPFAPAPPTGSHASPAASPNASDPAPSGTQSVPATRENAPASRSRSKFPVSLQQRLLRHIFRVGSIPQNSIRHAKRQRAALLQPLFKLAVREAAFALPLRRPHEHSSRLGQDQLPHPQSPLHQTRRHNHISVQSRRPCVAQPFLATEEHRRGQPLNIQHPQ